MPLVPESTSIGTDRNTGPVTSASGCTQHRTYVMYLIFLLPPVCFMRVAPPASPQEGPKYSSCFFCVYRFVLDVSPATQEVPNISVSPWDTIIPLVSSCSVYLLYHFVPVPCPVLRLVRQGLQGRADPRVGHDTPPAHCTCCPCTGVLMPKH